MKKIQAVFSKLHRMPVSHFVMQYLEAVVFFLGARPSAVKAWLFINIRQPRKFPSYYVP